MSFLEMKKAPLPDMTSGIISFWVKCQGGGKPDPWKPEWTPPKIETELKPNQQLALSGGSYWEILTVSGGQFGQPHLFPYPPGPYASQSVFQAEPPATFKNNFLPFITFGDPELPYKRVEWKLREIESKLFHFGPPRVGFWSLHSQFPEMAGGDGEKGIVPPSMIGLYTGAFKGEGDAVGEYSERCLRIILQTKNYAQVKGYAWAQSKAAQVPVLTPIGDPKFGLPLDPARFLPNVHAWVDFYIAETLTGEPRPDYRGEAIWYEDVSMLEFGQHPEAFVMDTGIDVGDGEWHHVLISFDLSGGAASSPSSSGGGSGGSNLGSPPTDGSSGSTGAVNAEALGPAGRAPLPGPYGQYSGWGPADVTAPPREDVGKYGYAEDGKIDSKCRAWVAIDGKNLTGKRLNHSWAWRHCERTTSKSGKTGKAVLATLDKNAILPPNAFWAPLREIRECMVTSLTRWERFYRTHLGGVTGPAAIISPSNEPRRLDYNRPNYEFTPGPLPVAGMPIGIPVSNTIKNMGEVVFMAELQIWANKSLDTSKMDNVRLFLTEKGEPEVSYKKVERVLGKPEIRLHGTENWKSGKNTGSTGARTVGSGGMRKKEMIAAGQFEPDGTIKRHLPDPVLKGGGQGT